MFRKKKDTKMVSRISNGIPVYYDESIDQVKFGMFVQVMLDKYGDRLMKCICEIQNGETKYSVMIRDISKPVSVNVKVRREK